MVLVDEPTANPCVRIHLGPTAAYQGASVSAQMITL
jgi:hypothetical protein